MSRSGLQSSEREALEIFVREAIRAPDTAEQRAAGAGRRHRRRRAGLRGCPEESLRWRVAAEIQLSAEQRAGGHSCLVFGSAGNGGGGYLLKAAHADLALSCNARHGRRDVVAGDLGSRPNASVRAWVRGVISEDSRGLLHLAALLAVLPGEIGTESASNMVSGS